MMEETAVPAVVQEEVFKDDFDSSERPLERWAPLGAALPDEYEPSHTSEVDRLRHLEEEQEELNQSLLVLTSHFGQVQFRLKQIITADPDDKEKLLKELEEFAFQGCPDIRSTAVIHPDQISDNLNEEEHESRIAEQRKKQLQLIDQLKKQLQDLETYAYQTGDAGMPQTMVMEKQRVIIDELKHKLQLDIENMEILDAEQLKQKVNAAIREIVNPAKVKEQLVSQLKTQIVDLERFIEFLQGEANRKGDGCHCTCRKQNGNSEVDPCCIIHSHPVHPRLKQKTEKDKDINARTARIAKRAVQIMTMFMTSHFGCQVVNKHFKKNELKKTNKGNHWGDMRAQLEIAVDKVVILAQDSTAHNVESNYMSDDESSTIECNEQLVTAVRKDLAVAIRDLIQHGLMEVGQSQSLVPFIGCMSERSSSGPKLMHAWELILKYYELKNGAEYNQTPCRKLSQTFNLTVVGGQAITSKQMLLGAISNVLSMHVPYKRSKDSQFKAFICAALNEKKLVTWLRLIFRTRTLVDRYYQPWSYVAKTGFDDGFRALENLTKLDFNLPVDLAVRQFQNIKHAF